MKPRIRILAAAAAILAATALAAAAPASSASPARHGCAGAIRLRHPESLRQLSRTSSIPVPILLMRVEQCDGYHNGWTRNMAFLLSGVYGSDIFTARLPAGTRFWLSL